MAERAPPTKRRRVCEHCRKEVSIKIYREHKRLFYNESSKSWVIDSAEALSSTDISSVDELDLTVISNDGKSATNGSDGDIQWDENSSDEGRDSENSRGSLIKCAQFIFSHLVPNYQSSLIINAMLLFKL